MRNMNKLYLLIFPILLSCGNKNVSADQITPTEKVIQKPDSIKLSYYNHIMQHGPKLYKYNCAMCHNGDPPSPPFLTNIFSKLPADSLQYYFSFIQNSDNIRPNIEAPHKFGETLQDSTIRILIEYIWLNSKARVHGL